MGRARLKFWLLVEYDLLLLFESQIYLNDCDDTSLLNLTKLPTI